jgi:hypothetical protein
MIMYVVAAVSQAPFFAIEIYGAVQHNRLDITFAASHIGHVALQQAR